MGINKSAKDAKGDRELILIKSEKADHNNLLDHLLYEVRPINFREVGGLTPDERLTQKHQLIISVEHLTKLAKLNKWGLAMHQTVIYIYNGAYWSRIEDAEFSNFLGLCVLSNTILSLIRLRK